MEEFKDQIIKAVKTAIKSLGKVFFVPFVILLVVLILLAAAVYYITVDDGTYKEDDWTSTGYGAAVYQSGVTINEDGTISLGQSAQEIWDKLVESGSSVADYLSGPEALGKLMNAQIVTNYPDMRPNVEEPIDWSQVDLVNGTSLQGIVKFRRADENGNISYMTYADPSTFYNWVEVYNNTGDETARQNALHHFTIAQTSTGTNSGSGSSGSAGEGITTEISDAIVKAAMNTPTTGPSTCLGWVDNVYANAGLPVNRLGTAYQAYLANCVSTNVDEMPIGAAVYANGSSPAGHVAIYIGEQEVNGVMKKMVRENHTISSTSSEVRTIEFDEWCNIYNGFLGWGWQTTAVPTQTTTTNGNSSSEETSSSSSSSGVTSLDNVLFIGDSITVGLQNSGLLGNAQVCAEVGTTPSNWLGRIGQLPTDSNNIQAVCVMLGVNNTSQTSEMESLIDALTSRYPNKTIYVQKVLPVTSNYTGISYTQMNQNIENYNNTISSYCNGKENVQFIDTSSGYVGEDGAGIASLFDSEGLHPTNYQMLKDNIENAILNGGSSSSSSSGSSLLDQAFKYNIVVATWSQTDTTVTTNDPNVSAYSTTVYTMNTKNVDYQSLIDKYTLPFNLLWAFLVVGESENFILDFADLAYNSQIEVTVYDNYTKNTDVDNWTYNYHIENHVSATATAGTVSLSNSFVDEIDNPRNTVKTVVTQTNTINVAVTKADVWIVDFETEYEHRVNEPQTTTEVNNVEDEPKPEAGGTYTTNSYNSAKISNLADRAVAQAQEKGEDVTSATLSINVTSYAWYKDIVDNISHTIESSSYISKPGTLTEKTDPNSEEPNFVTIFNDPKYERNNSSIRSAASWLFEIIETNSDTADMLDLIKYLLYKASGANYGVTEFDFSIFYPGSMTSLSGDWTQAGSLAEKLWLALRSAGFSEISTAAALGNLHYESGGLTPAAIEAGVGEINGGIGLVQWTGGRNTQLRQYAASQGKEWTDENIQIEFLLAELGVNNNASAYATVRTSGYIRDEGITATSSQWINATTIEDATLYFMRFFESPASKASLQARIDLAYQYYNQYQGYTGSASGELVEIARECHEYLRNGKYTYGNYYSIPPNSELKVDCSAYVCMVLRQYGYSEFGSSGLRGTWDFNGRISGNKFVGYDSWEVYNYNYSTLQPGDILLRQGHTAIYAGNGRAYDCGADDAISAETVSVDWGGPWEHIIRVKK